MKVMLPAERTLEDWFRLHTGEPLDLRTADFSEIDGFDLHIAVQNMIRAGKIRRVYRVLMPDGSFAPNEYREINQIPPKLDLSGGSTLNTADAEVVPLFFCRSLS